MSIYRLILVLAAAGPALAFAPATADEWVMACAEGPRPCAIDGTRMVQFGAKGTFNFGVATNHVFCSNETFGDPVPGVAKACWYKKSALEISLGALVAERDKQVTQLTGDVDALRREIRDLQSDLQKASGQVEKLRAELRQSESQRSLPPFDWSRNKRK